MPTTEKRPGDWWNSPGAWPKEKYLHEQLARYRVQPSAPPWEVGVMSVARLCDLCGEEITADQSWIEVETTSCVRLSMGNLAHYADGTAHYHSSSIDDDPDSCHERFLEVIRALREQSSFLKAIPVATPRQMAQLRPNDTRGAFRPTPFDTDQETSDAWQSFPDTIAARTCGALIRAGLDFDAALALTDEELLALRDVGPDTVKKLRQAGRAAKAGQR
jgi:hypothetical protein